MTLRTKTEQHEHSLEFAVAVDGERVLRELVQWLASI